MTSPLYLLLKTAQKRVERWIETEAAAEGVSAAQAALVLVLGRNDGALIGDVAIALDVAPSAMTSMADRMVRAGFIERRADPRDGRSSRLFLTDKGWAIREKAVGLLDELEKQMNQDLPPADEAAVRNWLGNMAGKFGREDGT
ncbi:DNA-binding MarR family transcriptional regulator [Caulobacter ginsengisoli]|uniref:DNA-binding MarR family transcriptional regulator n=1 Tax=Caulobacter ginsengisoli TaxID=400775 RepID=A0ABU0IVF2_9CAUL|nr:MarR family transcriptional regulator [Caulobacter ginsengisoli]MDQ0466000.1 DNA-binding MarR family transcriptional regulator [Caulobacter ginsengisoli]